MINMKKFTRIIALALAVGGVATLSACGTVKNATSTTPNWDIRIVSRNDLTDNSVWLTGAEVATYAVAFSHSSNTSYQFEYDPGTYTTKFYAEEYDWADNAFGGDKKELVYVYETQLSLSGRVRLGTEVKEFDNSVTTVAKFRSADRNLTPVYSRQEIDNTAPKALAAENIGNAYITLKATYETHFDGECTRAKIVTTDENGTNERTVEVPAEYSVFDCAQLGAAFRAFSFGGSHSFGIFNPIDGATDGYVATFASAVTLDNESETQIASAVNAACESGYLLAGKNEDGNVNVSYQAMQLSKNAALNGQSYIYWYASIANSAMNTTRAVMLRYIEPISFGHGTLTYTLSSLTFENN